MVTKASKKKTIKKKATKKKVAKSKTENAIDEIGTILTSSKTRRLRGRPKNTVMTFVKLLLNV